MSRGLPRDARGCRGVYKRAFVRVQVPDSYVTTEIW